MSIVQRHAIETIPIRCLLQQHAHRVIGLGHRDRGCLTRATMMPTVHRRIPLELRYMRYPVVHRSRLLTGDVYFRAGWRCFVGVTLWVEVEGWTTATIFVDDCGI